MRKLRALVETYYVWIVKSIAFWPTVLAVTGVVLGVLIRLPGNAPFVDAVGRVAPLLVISDKSVSLSLLTTLIGGLISLMVFSFSMVMVLLSNATSNLSPRLLPSLIGSRRHQFVLGTYIAAILFSIIVAMGFGDASTGPEPPGFAVGFAVLLGIVSLLLFVVFIHGVSQSIQVPVVLRRVHDETVEVIGGVLERQRRLGPRSRAAGAPLPDVGAWRVYRSPASGFFQGIDDHAAARVAHDEDCRFATTALRGRYVLEGEEIVRVGCADARFAELTSKLDDLLEFSAAGMIERYYGHGVDLVVEVAQKALSTGINDPSTALQAVAYLTHLFVLASEVAEYEVVYDSDDEPRVYLRMEPWHEAVGRQFDNVLTYGKQDPELVAELERMVDRLEETIGADAEAPRRQVIDRMRGRLRAEAEAKP